MAWLVRSFMFGIALAMDCLALSITDGLTMEGLGERKRRIFFIAGVFAVFQGVFPLIGYLLGEAFSQFIDKYDHWIGFALLLIIGGKMLFEGIRGLIKPEERKMMRFSVKSVLFQGVADSIDALAVGITVTANIQATATYQVYVCFAIIALCTFVISLLGLTAGKWISKLLRGHYEISEIFGGVILVALGVILLLEGLNVIAW
ncbi:MAG: manganese efflux pump MntP family protein [Bacilli bacterium]|nr:manganese efflux pump MntP family protein [Bacilli bacterium]